jgi:hypothetical protein
MSFIARVAVDPGFWPRGLCWMSWNHCKAGALEAARRLNAASKRLRMPCTSCMDLGFHLDIFEFLPVAAGVFLRNRPAATAETINQLIGKVPP